MCPKGPKSVLLKYQKKNSILNSLTYALTFFLKFFLSSWDGQILGYVSFQNKLKPISCLLAHKTYEYHIK
jgi:hypothetical protein